MSYDGFPFSCSVPSNELQEDEGEGEGEEEGEEITHMSCR